MQMALCVGARSLPSHFLYLSQNDFHRRIDIGRESSVEQANIRFCLFNFPEKWRGRHLSGPLRPFSQILSLELEYATRAGVTKEKNKFDQSEGGGYRFGYGFRKRRRILFLRKPDKGPFTRIFSHTRRLHPCRYSSKREMRISQTVYRSIHVTIPHQNIFCNIKNLQNNLYNVSP